MVELDIDGAIDDIEISEESEDEEFGNEEKVNKHKKLLDDLDEDLGHAKKKEFSTSRTEPSQEISEYNWSTNKDKVSLQDLVGSLDSKCKSVAKVKKKLQKMQNKTKVLDKPLEKIQRERVERSVAFEETSKDITKWNTTIQKNREAENLSFPLNEFRPPPMSTKNMVIEFKPRTDMEKQISEVLHGSKHLLERKNQELTEAEEKALEAVDLEEALERRKELQRTRALQSYYEAKCHRMKKIKSKKYHKLLKKEQQKALSKIDLETLSKENPELFASEMEKAEQLRAMERASLRHRNTSKWAKNLIVKGKNKSKDEQERVREQLKISRELTDHKKVEDSDEEEIVAPGGRVIDDEPIGELSLLTKTNNVEENPWLLDAKSGDGTTDSAADPSKEYVKLKPIKNIDAEQDSAGNENAEKVFGENEWDEAGVVADEPEVATSEKKKKKKKTKTKKQKRGEKEESLEVTKNDNEETENKNESENVETNAKSNELEESEVSEKKITKTKKQKKRSHKKKASVVSTEVEEEPAEINDVANEKNENMEDDNESKEQEEQTDNISAPANKLKLIRQSMKNNNAISEVVASDTNKQYTSSKANRKNVVELCANENSDDEVVFDNTEQAMNIMEAFAGDDVMGDFIQEKQNIIDKDKPKAVDLTLPGWGDWGGPGLTISKRKRKRFTKKSGPPPKRKDDGMSNVIINEGQNEKFAKHQVASVPFPYTNKIEFERSIRQPIGGHWNTPSVHNKLIEPRVQVRAGVAIAPMKASKNMKRKFQKELAAAVK